MKKYSPYYLIDNPFPRNPAIDPQSSDIRINGTIFNAEIRSKELDDFEEKIKKGLSLIYVRAAFKERGMGKSAILVHEWGKLRQREDVTAIYIKLSPAHRPQDFCTMIVKEWHENGYLWTTLKSCLQNYTKNAPIPILSKEIINGIARRYPEMPDEIDIRRYVYNPKKLMRSLREWFRSLSKGILHQVVEAFFESYLSTPLDFYEKYISLERRIKAYDQIDFYKTMLDIMKTSDFKHHYFFLDQFEYAITEKTKKELFSFCADMRRLLEAGSGYTTIGVTLHLDANQYLSMPEASHLYSMVPLDPRFIVDLEQLNPERACKLALTYMDHFRLDKPPDPYHPFDKDSIGYICDEVGGNTRRVLRSLRFALVKGVNTGYPSLNKDFIKENLEEIAGRAVLEEEE